ncbi:MAG TPA: RHS repeat-associated core domain-containing protein, partial [Prosthecobacter sp.]|nr:RHS repeat-associated core domain-containing protein [Prosthecobacter sp.]HRK16433.1 RHS repeat-associated core domain-containing protein [Prosthecobacter sp.]
LETMTWLSRDPAGFVDGPNLYAYVQQNPWTAFDPLGLWGEAGHFWTTYGVAVAAGLPPQKAFTLAYYSQVPDEHVALDAWSLWKSDGNTASMFRTTNRRETLNYIGEGRDLHDWSMAVQRNIHSLHGGDAEAVRRRQGDLRQMVQNGGSSDMERGLLIHAYGDSYAHVNASGSAYSTGNGHGWDSRSNATDPDLIGNRPQRHRDHMGELYSALNEGGGKPELLDSLVETARGIQSRQGNDTNNNDFGTAIRGNELFGWNTLPQAMRDYNPNAPMSRIPATLPDPTADQVEQTMNRQEEVYERNDPSRNDD